MISWRGVLAVGVGGLLLAFGWRPETLGEMPPTFIRAILLIAGAGMVAVGLVSIDFVIKRHRLLARVAPERADLVVTNPDSSDSTTYLLDVRVAGSHWQMGAVGQAVRALPADVALDAQVWRDPKTGAPLAVAVGGVSLETLPVPRRVNDLVKGGT